MGFQDTFARDENGKSDLQYDDTAFLYFFVAVLAAVIVPLIYSLAKPFIINPVKQKLQDICQCDSCKQKAEKLYQKNKKNFITGGYKLKLIITLILIVLAFKCYVRIDVDNSGMKKFDPYEILEISPNADLQEIKKAYRSLSRKYHPDKAKNDPEATAKFIIVGKAYECLTDEAKKAMCEKFGNPDGPGKMNMAIAMPSFLLKKENHVAVLLVFFFLLLVVLPCLGWQWYKKTGIKNEHGIRNTNKRGFYQRLNESLIVKNCPVLLALSDEYQQFPAKKSQIQDLDKLMKELDQDSFSLKKLPDQVRTRFTIPYILICAHLQGLEIPESLYDYYFKIITIAPQLIQGMISFVMEHPFFHRRVPIQQRGQLKFFGSDVMLRLIEFQQLIVQGLWVSFNKDDIYQLSYFNQNPDVKKNNNRYPKLKELIDQPEDQRKLNFVPEQFRDSVNKELNKIPNIAYDVFCGVEGEDTITDLDILTIKVIITRKNLKRKQTSKLVHAVNFPSFRYEKFHFILSTENKEVISYQLITGDQQKLECQLQSKFPAGKYSFVLNVKSDSYKGMDLEQNLKFEVLDNSKVERKIEWHKDDEQLDNQPTLFNQMMQQMNPGNEDSDEEEEDEDAQEQKTLKKTQKKGLQSKDLKTNSEESKKKESESEEEEEDN